MIIRRRDAARAAVSLAFFPDMFGLMAFIVFIGFVGFQLLRVRVGKVKNRILSFPRAEAPLSRLILLD